MQQVPKPQQHLYGQITALMGQSYVLHTPEAIRDALRRGTQCVHHPSKAGPFYLMLPLNTQPQVVRDLDLRTLPEREQWDEIVAVLPKWYYTGVKGMGDKLAGVGIYIQPLASEVPDDLGGTEGMQSMSMVSTNNGDHDTATVDPKTGEKGNNSTFVAMFMYMQKITFDAKTLAVKSREVRRDNVKYYDPNSDALDVGKMFNTAVLAKGLSEVVEKSARKAITGNVIVSDLKEVPQPQPAPVKKP